MGRPRKEPLSEMEELAKAIGDDGLEVLKELEGFDVEALNQRIAQANHAISETESELKENPEYCQAKDDVKLLSSGLREVKKRQRSVIKVCLRLRKDKGAA